MDLSTLSRINPAGPVPSEIMLVGEAPGSSEVILKAPFLGASGQELRAMLKDVGIDFNSCYRTNVFLYHPPNNNVSQFFVPTKDASPEAKKLGFPERGKYLNDLFLPEITRLYDEIKKVSPKIIVSLGNTPLWALTSHIGIGKYRGVILYPDDLPPILPTYHPAAVLRNFAMRAEVVADLRKIHHILSPSQTAVTEFNITVNPTLDQIKEFYFEASSAPAMAVDVETKASMIRTIGFAISSTRALVIPFWDTTVPNYWKTPEEELEAMRWVAKLLNLPNIKVLHNGAYDIQYIWKTFGMTLAGRFHDTMLMHHAMQPEQRKSLGFLGSIYLNFPAWKEWRKQKEEKKDA